MRYRSVIAAVALVCTASTAPALADDPPPPPGTPTAAAFDGIAIVGPLFGAGLDASHGCTATVVASSTRDLVLTAAHCVTGTAAGMQFAPGYDRGATPYGVWTVSAAYVDPAWIAGQDPARDYAILRVSGPVQDVTGGARIGTTPRPGTRITDVAYNAGLDDQPVTCSTHVYLTGNAPSFSCHGYVGGSSGSPWLSKDRRVVRGVIGGLYDGGCFEYTSYSPPFDAAIVQLVQRATVHAGADAVPSAPGSGC